MTHHHLTAKRTRWIAIIAGLGAASLCSITLTRLTLNAPRIPNDSARLDTQGVYTSSRIDAEWPSYWLQAGLWIGIVAILLLLVGVFPAPPSSTRPRRRNLGGHKYQWGIIFLTLLGLALRLHSWNNLPLIIDEIGFAAHASDILDGQRVPLLAPGHNANPSLYSVMLSDAMRLIGHHILAIRLVPIVFGTLTIPALYALGRVWWSPLAGLLAAAFLATFPAHVHFSRLSVYNAVEPFFSILALVFLVRASRTGQLRYYLMAGALAAAAQHLYHGSRLWLALMLLYALLELHSYRHMRKTRLIGLVWMGITLVLLTLPQIAVLMRHDLPVTSNLEPLRLPDDLTQNSLRAVGAWVGQSDVSPFWLSDQPLLLVPAMLAFVVGFVVAIRRWREPRYLLLLLAPILTTIFGGTILTATPLFIRYITAVAAIALLVVLSVEHLMERWPKLAATAIVLICLHGLWTAWQHPQEAQGRITASQWIEHQLAQQTASLPPDTSVLFLVPSDFDTVQMITLADAVAFYGHRRAIAVNRDEGAMLNTQLDRLPLPFRVIDGRDE